MKIQLASDLHLEFLQRKWPEERLVSPAPEADVLVLAGDVASGIDGCRMFVNSRVPVVYVAGNHEYFGHVIGPTLNKIREVSAESGIHFLENSGAVIKGVRFLGCTLWTDYLLRPDLTQAQAMAFCERSLSDHWTIKTGRHSFAAQDALDRHTESLEWLSSELAKPFDGKTVVVTHHGPHPLSVHQRYAGDALSAGYVSDLSGMLPLVDLWLHGHVHDSFDYQVGRCRVVANPAGYVSNRQHAKHRHEFIFENEKFVRQLLVDV